MFRASEIIGKPIVDYNSGTVLNRIADVVYDSTNHALLGFAVDESWMLSRGRMVPFSMARSIGPDAVMVDDEAAIITDNQDPDIAKARKESPELKGRRVLTEDGQNLGSVVDFFFNTNTGAIEGYEVSGGMVNDVYTGASFLPIDHIKKIGDDVVLVTNDTTALFRDQVGGVRAVAEDALSSARQQAGYSLEFMDTAVQDIRSKSRSGLEDATDRAEGAKTAAGSLWEEVKERATDFRERGAEKIEEQRIKGALGRPVTRVILDEDDNIILNTGDLITHEAIALARRAGTLDILLNSVYMGTPDFDKENMRVKEGDEQ